MTDTTIPRHQWTHDGRDVLVVRSGAVGYGGFQWPTTIGATVRVDHPRREADCDDGGYYGWPWGFGIGDGKDPDWAAPWLVFAADPADVIAIGDKVKCCGECRIVHVGTWASALAHVSNGRMAWIQHAARGAASATGVRGAASATGERGAASATGESGAAVVTGLDGRAQGGPYGCLALAWWNAQAIHIEMRCARVGCGDGSDGPLKAHTWYQLDARGEFVELRDPESR